MPMATCPACRGAKTDAEGKPCWGCNGHGIVELTSDDEADVVRRGGYLVDRGTNRPGTGRQPRRAGCSPVILLGLLLTAAIACGLSLAV